MQKSKDIPDITLSATDCIIKISGNSYSDHVADLYDRIKDWIDKEVQELNCVLNCVFHFNVLNSISKKSIITILLKLNRFYKTGTKIKITWYCKSNDEENIEVAEELKLLTEIPFEIKIK